MWDNPRMPLQERILGHFHASAQAKLDAAEQLALPIEEASALIVHCLTQGGKVLACGNGASAANSQVFASQMVNRFEQERPGLAAVTLAADVATLTSIADDLAYEQVFARQVRALGVPGDVLLAISAAGDAHSVLAALEAAHARGMNVIVLAGRSGAALAEQMQDGDVFIGVPAESPARIQEVHLLVIHCLCDAVDSVLLGVE
jgi:D-sedoheptulose 7-phosphate isomerase